MQADLCRSGLPLSVTADDGGQITHPETTPNLSCQISSGFIEFGPEPFPVGRLLKVAPDQRFFRHAVAPLVASFRRAGGRRWWHPLGFGHGHCPQPPFRQDVPGSTP